MTKIAVLIASPRKDGNSEALVNAMTDGAMGLSTNEIYLYHLDGLKIVHGCKACGYCKTHDKCVQNDDLTPILDDIASADGVIVSTPLYFGHAASQYRVLEDRFYSFMDEKFRSKLTSGKKVAVIVTCAGTSNGAENCANNIEDVFKMFGFESIGKLVYSEMEGNGHAKNNEEFLSKAREIGRLLRNN